MKKLSPDTIEKLEWLKGRLRKYPHRYDQGTTCGTQACLYGHCWPRMLGSRKVTLTKKEATGLINRGDWEPAKDWAQWLGVSWRAAEILFTGEWYGKAEKFNRIDEDTDEQAAEKACQRIDLFIQSGGTQ